MPLNVTKMLSNVFEILFNISKCHLKFLKLYPKMPNDDTQNDVKRSPFDEKGKNVSVFEILHKIPKKTSLSL